MTRRGGEVGSFGVARERWLGGLGNVRNVVRQEIITRQLRKHLPDRPGRVLDVGAGQGTQSLRLARAGHRVVAVEPDPEMRAQLRAALHTDPADAGERVTVVAGSVGDLGSAIAADGYAELDPPAPADPNQGRAMAGLRACQRPWPSSVSCTRRAPGAPIF